MSKNVKMNNNYFQRKPFTLDSVNLTHGNKLRLSPNV